MEGLDPKAVSGVAEEGEFWGPSRWWEMVLLGFAALDFASVTILVGLKQAGGTQGHLPPERFYAVG